MTSLFGMALLPLWIMGVPVIGAVISLFMSAPKGNTMPHLRHADGTSATTGHQTTNLNHGSTVAPAMTGTAAASTSYPHTSNV